MVENQTLAPRIVKANPNAEYFFDEGCFILELSNSSSDPDVSIARATVKPGVTTALHRLQVTIERYVLLAGTGLVEIDGLAPQTVSAGDVVIIPALCTQRITNISEDDLVFLAICTPRFLLGNYEALAESHAFNSVACDKIK